MQSHVRLVTSVATYVLIIGMLMESVDDLANQV